MEKTQDKPVFGVIAYSGGTWTVNFEDHGNVTNQTLTGYGFFPFDRFDIPVIDFTDNEQVWDWLHANPQNLHPISKQLDLARKMGLNIIEPAIA